MDYPSITAIQINLHATWNFAQLQSSKACFNCVSKSLLNVAMRNRLILAGLAVMASFSCPAENWPQWRGPNFDGSSPEKSLPADFSKTQNIKWFAPLPGSSAA